MNSKGFTLVELLVTIAILALVVVIAVPSYTGISNAIRESSRNNKIAKIEVEASKYAFDTGKTIIFVDELVTEGYIESDDEDGNITDPVNNERMNCYIVEMEKVSDYYNAKFIDNKNYDINGVCDLSKLQESSKDVFIQVLNNSEIVTDTNKWLKGNISLSAYSNTLNLDCITNRCSWTSSSGASSTGGNVDISYIRSLLETKYTFQYTIYDNESDEVKRYTTSVNLKIDNESPIIYSDEVVVTNRFVYSSYKNVTIKASDGNGSGIVGYYLALDTGDSCYNTSVESKFQESNTFKVSQNGTYLICVKDSVGNISSNSLKISYIS